MAFTLRIETSNAAFITEPDWSTDPTYMARQEVARILEGISNKIEFGEVRGVCRDINGNQVGHWRLEVERDWECPRCHTINREETNEPGDVTCVDCHNTVSISEVLA